MNELGLVLEILIAVLASSVLSRFIPKVSTPLVQIMLGIVWYFIPGLPTFTIDSELFMVLFIAPLLFLEARNAPRREIASNLGLSLSLAIGLVLLSLMVTGITLHVLWPAVPLAAALALGAALGPTDAVAVSALGKEANLTKRQLNILQGESLFNDAASIVAFQWATVVALGAAFHPARFAASITKSFIVGVLIGAVIGMLANRLVQLLRKAHLETTTMRIGIEILIPFAAYLCGELAQVSGVLAVVSAGLVVTFHRYGVGSDIARTNLVSNSVWQFLEFSLNGAVFVLLGIELPQAFRASWIDAQVDTRMLLLAIVVLTVVSLILRFVWMAIMLRTARDTVTGKRRPMTAKRWRSAAVMTFGGPKGTISLVLAFTLPYAIDESTHIPLREALLFIAAGYIVVSLLLANIMLPLLAPMDDDDQGLAYAQVQVEMLRRTLQKIAELDTPQNHAELQVILHSYTDRIERVRQAVPQERTMRDNAVRASLLEWERQWLKEYVHAHPEDAASAQPLIERIELSLSHVGTPTPMRLQARKRTHIAFRSHIHPLARNLLLRLHALRHPHTAKSERTRALQRRLFEEAIVHLRSMVVEDTDNAETIARLIGEYRAALVSLQPPAKGLGLSALPSLQGIDELRMRAFRLELETIRDMLDEDALTRLQAKMLRQNVYLMQADAAL